MPIFPHEAVELLLGWYRANARDLPWRSSRDPYRVLVSEIMLQQTRAETVKPYFTRFMDRLPTVKNLALAEEATVLKLWEGLGYYSRARNLQKAARVVMEKHGGVIPADVDALRALPGVGSYTAGAVASIAFDIPVPAVDGNVLRVVARLTGDDRDVLLDATKRATEVAIAPHVPSPGAGDFTQSLIELGALICLPGAEPKCAACPLSLLCVACREGRQGGLPVRIPKTRRRVMDMTVLAVCVTDGRDGHPRFAIRRRPDEGLLAGLYEFPWVEGFLDGVAVTEYLTARGLKPTAIQSLPHTKHIFTHITWEMNGFLVRATVDDAARLPSDWTWASVEDMQTTYTIPGAHAAFRDVCRAVE